MAKFMAKLQAAACTASLVVCIILLLLLPLLPPPRPLLHVQPLLSHVVRAL
jgi:hypothetical protein